MSSRGGSVRGRLLAGFVLLGVAGVSLSACGSTPASTTGSSLMTKALLNATEAGWVHEVINETSGKHYLRQDNHIGTASGSQSVNLDGELADIKLVNGVAYIEGNEAAILHFFGLPAKDKKYAGKWIAIKAADTGYTQVTATLTLKGDFAQYKLSGKVKKGAVVELDGQPARAITGGTGKIHETLYVSTTGTILPIEITLTNGPLHSMVTWATWGTAAPLTVPSPTVSITTVEG